MSALGYIKIRGYNGTTQEGEDPGTFEVFQGIGSGSTGAGGGSAGGDFSFSFSFAWTDPEADGYELRESLWLTQIKSIKAQNQYLWELSEHLGSSSSKGGLWGVISDIFTSVFEEIIQQAIGEAIEYWLGIPDDLAEVAAAFLLGIWEAFLIALDEFDHGHEQCVAMIEENDALLGLEMSYENYRLRMELLEQHENTIRILSDNIGKNKTSLIELFDTVLRIASLFTGDTQEEENSSDWVEIFNDLEETISSVDEWVQDAYVKDASDLPIPAPPQLPTLPDKNKHQPSKAIIFYVAKLAIKLFMEWLRQHKEHDPDTAEAMEKAFFFIDPADGQKKSILERGLLKHYPTEVLALLEVLDQDVALRDATIDFGNFRITVKGKTIQYG